MRLGPEMAAVATVSGAVQMLACRSVAEAYWVYVAGILH